MGVVSGGTYCLGNAEKKMEERKICWLMLESPSHIWAPCVVVSGMMSTTHDKGRAAGRCVDCGWEEMDRQGGI